MYLLYTLGCSIFKTLHGLRLFHGRWFVISDHGIGYFAYIDCLVENLNCVFG
jgi:hypothetical protein